MAVKNSYPLLPELTYQKTSIEMSFVVVFAKTLIGKYSKDTVCMAYAIFRNESGNGQYGVNENYAGIQADVGVWENLPGVPIGTVIKKDNAGDLRRFLAFKKEDGYKVSFELLCIKIEQRNMITIDDYFDKWVSNSKEDTPEARKNFSSLLKAAAIVFE